MPWYYAGSDAKPVGPLSLDELRACREQGTVKPETYVIEHTGQPFETLTWKRYQDVVPVSSILPPLPPLGATPPPVPLPAPMPAPAAHPLFPSATPRPGYAPPPPIPLMTPGAPLDPYQHKTTNAWCLWGFIFAIIGGLLSIVCGIGLLPAGLGFFLCLIGLFQVNSQRTQSGHGLAIWGLVVSFLAIAASIAVIYFLDVKMFKSSEITVTEQTSNDSE